MLDLKKTYALFCAALIFPISSPANQPQNQFNTGAERTKTTQSTPSFVDNAKEIEQFCQKWSKKLNTIKYEGCMKLELQSSQYRSAKDDLLTYRHFYPGKKPENNQEKPGKILFISGIHGDEYSAISITYLWMHNILKHESEREQHWLFLPLANPDGLFRKPGTRTNANNVDINRNFPSPDWDELALKYWAKYNYKSKRRYPGPKATSEPETKWIVSLIDEFKPDAIISVHAPFGLVDYDGPDYAVPNRIGHLKHRELGTYPGSLGRYAGEYLNIPVLTLELRTAGFMPSDEEIFTMWKDLEVWIDTKLKGRHPETPPTGMKPIVKALSEKEIREMH